jgi:hypothetical protein
MKKINLNLSTIRILAAVLFFFFLTASPCDAQQPRWAFGIGGSGNEYVYPMLTDNMGDIIMAGYFSGTGVDFDPGTGEYLLSSLGYTDVFVAKYTATGDLMWAFAVGGEIGEACYGMDIDDQGNIYITGTFSSPAPDFDPGPGTATIALGNGTNAGFVAAYDSDGNYLWAFSIPCLGTSGMIAGYTLDVDINNDVIVTGFFQGDDISFDPAGTVSVTSNDYSQDIFLAKYTSAGTFKWVNAPGGTEQDYGEFVCSDPLGNHYLCGLFMGTGVDFEPGPGEYLLSSAGGSDAFLVKYDNDGHVLWGFAVGATAQDAAFGIALDSDTSVYINGNYGGTVDFDPGAGVTELTSMGIRDVFFAKYTKNGEMIYAKSIGSTLDDNSQAIAVDSDHNLYITGYFAGEVNDFDPGTGTVTLPHNANNDLFFGRYTDNGNLGWVAAVTSTGEVNGYRIQWLPDGDVLLSGVFSGNNVDFDPGEGTWILNGHGYSSDIFLARYAQAPFGLEQRSMAGDLSAWPNPVKDRINIIPGGTAEPEKLQAILQDLQGKTILLVSGSLNTVLQKLNARFGDLDNGMYFLRIDDGERVLVQKVIKQD